MPQQPIDYTTRYQIRSGRVNFANYVQRRQLVQDGALLGLNLLPPDNDASIVPNIQDGAANTTPAEYAEYLAAVEQSEFDTVTPNVIETIQTFTTVGSTTWTAPAGVTSVEYLVVGGGGGGGGSYDGGAGAGGGGGLVLYGASYAVTPDTSYTVIVGDGGLGGIGVGNGGGDGTSFAGGNSQFGTIVASGGGAGGGSLNDRSGSGGTQGDAGTLTAPSGGKGGRTTGLINNQYGAGGGGGMGSAGATAVSTTNAAGGSGILYSISGSSITYSAGGSGGRVLVDTNGSSGTPNTGNGGQGSGAPYVNGSTGGKGGSGIVILKYLA